MASSQYSAVASSQVESRSGSCDKRLKLFSSWRSSCSWRVRIALNVKGIPYEYKAVNLAEGEHHTEEYKKLNPLQYVPALVDDGVTISDSLAIILYLEDKYHERPLLPADPWLKALNLQVAACIGSNIQPVQSGVVLKIIAQKLGPDERLNWARHFIEKGLTALEKLLEEKAGKYSTGDQVSLADVFLVPQVASARKFNVDMSKFPTLDRINQALIELPEFQAAAPDRQPDASTQ